MLLAALAPGPALPEQRPLGLPAGLAGAPLAGLALEGAPRPGGPAQLPGPRGEGPGWASHFPSVGRPPGGAHGHRAWDSPSPVISDTAPLRGSPPHSLPTDHPRAQTLGWGPRAPHTAQETRTPSPGQGRGCPMRPLAAARWAQTPPGRGHRLPAEGQGRRPHHQDSERCRGSWRGVLPPQTAWKGPPSRGSAPAAPQLPGVARLSRHLGHVTAQPGPSPECRPHSSGPPDLFRGPERSHTQVLTAPHPRYRLPHMVKGAQCAQALRPKAPGPLLLPPSGPHFSQSHRASSPAQATPPSQPRTLPQLTTTPPQAPHPPHPPPRSQRSEPSPHSPFFPGSTPTAQAASWSSAQRPLAPHAAPGRTPMHPSRPNSESPSP